MPGGARLWQDPAPTPVALPTFWVRTTAFAIALLCATVAGSFAQGTAAQPVSPAQAAYDRGRALRLKGDQLGSRPHLREAADLAQKDGNAALLQRALYDLGEVQGFLSDWAGMLDYAQRSYDALPDPKGKARMRYLSQRGRVFQELRERDQALAAYLESVELAKALGDESELAGLYNELGLVSWRLDRDFATALAYYDESIALFGKLGEDINVATGYNNSGNLFRKPDSYPEAERRYRAGLAAARRAGFADDPFLLKNLGIVLRETGRRQEAEHALLRAVHVADTQGYGRIQWQGRMELGTFYSTTDTRKAADYFEQTLTALEAQNNNVLLEGFRAGSLSGAVTIYDDPYDLYTDMLMTHGRERDAFYVAERARARAFLDTLSLAREEIAGVLPAQFVTEERSILERINANQATLRAGNLDADRRAALGREISGDEERLTNIRVRLAIDHPALANARYPQILKVDDVQAKVLRPNEVLLQYFVGAQSGTLWIITPTAFHVRRLPARKEIETAVRAFLDTLGRPDGDFKTGAKQLGAMLLPDLAGVLSPVSRLIVVPHGSLNYVPFEALLERDLFLIERYAVSYAPSTSSLAFLRSRASSGTEVVAVGNPVMRAAGTATERGQRLDRIGALKPLLHAGPEVRAVSAVYGSVAHVFEQETATEAVLSGPDAARAGIIHIATHGLIDEEMPDRSGLALTAAPPADGILQMREIYKLRFNAALVTLSACQTALGKAITGEGIVGLSRAFFYAGSNAVLASLWNVNDASTERLMGPFYRALAKGQPIDDALRAAKLTMVRDGGRLSHPYFGAAFVVTGDGAAQVPVKPAALARWTVTMGAVLLLGAALFGGALAWSRFVRVRS